MSTLPKAAVPKALSGYKEINLRGLKLLKPGGYLVTCSCSYNVSESAFANVIASAVADAHAAVEAARRAFDETTWATDVALRQRCLRQLHESLIEHRASVEGPTTISPRNLLRVSVGLENAQDLIEDLERALGS